jgi:hypothetical protein
MIRWKAAVAASNYAGALAYLSLRYDTPRARATVKALRDADLTRRRANDILRAARLEPAPLDDPGVLHALRHVAKGHSLSPVLIANLELGVDIADGYHRVSLTYHLDPFAAVPCKLAD